MKKRLVQGGVAALTMISLGLAAMAAQGAFRAYYANDEYGRNVVMILSEAPLETMLTRTGKVTADIQVNPDDALDNPKARFVVDMASLDTGIALRNEHMRADKWLDTAKYPQAVFTLTKLSGITRDVQRLEAGKTRRFVAEGTMEMHGATREVKANVEVTPFAANEETAARLPGDLLRVKATFPLKLDDFGIIIPPPAKLKLANEQQVTVDVFASTGSKAPVAEPPVAAPAVAKKIEEKPVMSEVKELVIEDVKVGDGAEAKAGQRVTVHYRGTFPDGRVFDESYKRGQPFTFTLGGGEVIKGWDQGVAGMKVGGKRKLTIPPHLAYGARGAAGVIPPNATLHFEVELLGVG